jgi:hypothetical protein
MKSQILFFRLLLFLLFSLNAKAQDSLHYIVIRDASDGGGSKINDFTINAGDSVILYAASYDTAGNFIGDQIANWTTNGTLVKWKMTGQACLSSIPKDVSHQVLVPSLRLLVN